MGEMEEERDNVGKLYENFVQASTCKGTLQAFSVLCRQLDLDPMDNNSFYSSLKSKVTTWKAKALWSKLDKRMSHKEFEKGQACAGTKVSLTGDLVQLFNNTRRNEIIQQIYYWEYAYFNLCSFRAHFGVSMMFENNQYIALIAV